MNFIKAFVITYLLLLVSCDNQSDEANTNEIQLHLDGKDLNGVQHCRSGFVYTYISSSDLHICLAYEIPF